MDGYLRAASQISRLAVGDRNASGDVGHLQDCRAGVADAPVEGAPMGTRGGISVVHTFPADGHYVVQDDRCTTSRSAGSSAATR